MLPGDSGPSEGGNLMLSLPESLPGAHDKELPALTLSVRSEIWKPMAQVCPFSGVFEHAQLQCSAF